MRIPTSSSSIDFSAEFGGRDAAAAVLPHFKLLKAAANGLSFQGFPFPELAYILRVDGSVNAYAISASGNLEIDADREYLSLDIGIRRDQWDRAAEVISKDILASPEKIRLSSEARNEPIDFESLELALTELVSRYRLSADLHPDASAG
jgi:hypothetical protein